MATRGIGTGLLSKVAKFVLNPTVDWVDLDKPPVVPEEVNSKHALKQMIERKQYNDAVRKREFDKLRKLRRSAVPDMTNATQPPTSDQDSWGYAVYQERANTLKKIDEIEAQMSKQWWKGRDGPAPGKTADRGRAPVAAQAGKSAQEPMGIDSAFATTMPADLIDTESGENSQQEPPVSQLPVPAVTAQTVTGVLTTPAFVCADAPQNQVDPRLEEAAIRFANSDDGGAESVLLAALQTPAAPTELVKTWASALLDLYRATGQQASFDQIASEYSLRFACPVPTWGAGLQSSGSHTANATSVQSSQKDRAGYTCWSCPAELDATKVAQLQSLVKSSLAPCWLDWSAVKTITPQAAQPLAVLLANWCTLPLVLHLEGTESLDHLLRLHTPMGDNQVAPFWWQLRLDLMRILRLHDEFELLALDFCVTYEKSPPTWQAARCQHIEGPAATAQAALSGPAAAALLPAIMYQDTASPNQPLALTGEVLGDASQVLQALQTAFAANNRLVVLCADLIRVDFSAGGSILNWLANAQATGGHIELRDVHQLIAVFFNLIGINEHAHIVVRTN